jgi:hypothetical protein
MVATATRTILENLDRIPNEDERTKVSIIAFDTSIYFFSIAVRYSLRFMLWSFLMPAFTARERGLSYDGRL